MKKNIFFILITFFNVTSFAQNIFQTIISEPQKSKGPLCILQTQTNGYIIGGCEHKYEPFRTGSNIIKLSENGSVIHERIYFIDDTLDVINDLLQKSNNNYLQLNVLAPSDNATQNNYIALSEITENFETLWEVKIKFPIDTMRIMSINMEKGINDEILCYGFCQKNEIEWAYFIYKISEYGDSLNFVNLGDYGVSDLIVNQTNEKIYYMGNNFESEFTVLNYSDFSIDTVVNFENIIGHHFNGWSYIELINDEKIVINGTNFTQKGQILIFDTLYNFVNSCYNIGIQNFYGQLPQVNSLSVNMENEIFTAIHYPVFGSRKFSISKFNKDLNMMWQKNYDTDEMYFWYILNSTLDGGFIIVGFTVEQFSKICVIKGDANGNITHINGKPSEQRATEILLSPNPASTEINIQKAAQLNDNTEIAFYDLSGKLVLNQKLTNQSTTINISHLPEGMYIYKCYTHERIVESGKMIKKD